MTDQTEVTYEALPDGTTNLLTLKGGRPGPHQARVRHLHSGLPLGFPTWLHDQETTLRIPAWAADIAVQIDVHPETGAWLTEHEVAVVPLDEMGKPKKARKRSVPSVKANRKLDEENAALHNSATRPEDFAPEPTEEKAPKIPSAKTEDGRRHLQHIKAAEPHRVDDTPVDPPPPPADVPPAPAPQTAAELEAFLAAREGKSQDPVTAEEKAVEHDKAAFPVTAERGDTTEVIEAQIAEGEKVADEPAPPARDDEERERLADEETSKVVD